MKGEAMRTTSGVEYARDGRRVSAEEIRTRGLAAVGKRVRAEREQDAREGRAHRQLGEVEQRALEAVGGDDAPIVPPASPEPPATPPAEVRDVEGEARLQRARLQHEHDKLT